MGEKSSPVRRRRPDRALLASVFSAAFLIFLIGFAVAEFNLPPAGKVRAAIRAYDELSENWRNDLGIEPTRALVAAPPGRQRVVVHDAGLAQPGYRLVSGLVAGRSTLHGVTLLSLDGEELHFWPVDYELFSPNGRDAENIFLHGLSVLEDGSLIVNFDGGEAIARLDACGKPLWVVEGLYHHVVSRGHGRTVWAWLDRSAMVALDADTGRELRRIVFLEDVVEAHQLYGIFAIHTRQDPERLLYRRKGLHPNDIEELLPEYADAFPLFDAGDLMFSLRGLNLIGVLDGQDYRLKWWRIGPWHRQHDPDFLPDGTIAVYNNNMALGASSIEIVDPVTDEVRTFFRSSDQAPFYSWRRGKHQYLPNGNFLVAESERGRVFEVTPDSKVVWEFHNVYDEDRNGLVNLAMVLAVDFFHDGLPVCDAEGSAVAALADLSVSPVR